MIDRVMRMAGRYGLPLQVQSVQGPEQGVQKTAEPLIRPVEQGSRSIPPRDARVPREEWAQYVELRQMIRMLRCPYRN